MATQQVFSCRGKPRRNPLCELFYAVQLNEQDKGISPVFSAFTVRGIYVSCLFIDTDKQALYSWPTDKQREAGQQHMQQRKHLK